MKVFQILSGVCYSDVTSQFPNKESTKDKFTPETVFVEAPDYVFTGWGYIDGEFIQPTPPEGFLYDVNTGTFYRIGDNPQVEKDVWQEMAEALKVGIDSV